jgi:hypothetical protein
MALVGCLILVEIFLSALLFRVGLGLVPRLEIAALVLLVLVLIVGLVRSQSTSKKLGWLVIVAGAAVGFLITTGLATNAG